MVQLVKMQTYISKHHLHAIWFSCLTFAQSIAQILWVIKRKWGIDKVFQSAILQKKLYLWNQIGQKCKDKSIDGKGYYYHRSDDSFPKSKSSCSVWYWIKYKQVVKLSQINKQNTTFPEQVVGSASTIDMRAHDFVSMWWHKLWKVSRRNWNQKRWHSPAVPELWCTSQA